MCTTTRIDLIGTGRRISDLRKERDLSIKEIQYVLGFNTPQAIFKWLRGDTLPTIDNLVVLAEIFDTTIDDILVISR
ncbi:MAG: helix-turn-helix transcriptional regulator [Erysipelotrichaceae bacterium]|nr:helix-turn-helix transcriptional regulator [Erysipelotrichaceae bacterium]